MFKNGYEYIIVKRYEPADRLCIFYLCSLLKYYFIKTSFYKIIFRKIIFLRNNFSNFIF